MRRARRDPRKMMPPEFLIYSTATYLAFMLSVVPYILWGGRFWTVMICESIIVWAYAVHLTWRWDRGDFE